MYVRMYVCMYVCIYVRMYVCMYVRMYVCMYICVYLIFSHKYHNLSTLMPLTPQYRTKSKQTNKLTPALGLPLSVLELPAADSVELELLVSSHPAGPPQWLAEQNLSSRGWDLTSQRPHLPVATDSKGPPPRSCLQRKYSNSDAW